MFKGVKIDARTQEYIEKRLETISKVNGKILQFEVEIDLDKKGKFRVELMVKTPYNLFRSEETTESIEGSTDIAVEEIKTQIIKDKERVKDVYTKKKRDVGIFLEFIRP